MPVSIKGTGGGSVTLSAAAAAADTTLTIPNVTGTVLQSGTAVTVAQGGTGATSLAANNVLLGNGTSALQVVAPGTSGNVLTSNGTAWTSAAPASTASLTLLATLTTTSGTTQSATGLPTTYNNLLIVCIGTTNSTGSNNLTVAISANNGSSYGTAVNAGSYNTTTGIQSGSMFIFAANQSIAQRPYIGSEALASSAPIASSTYGAINAIRFAWASGYTFNAGTIYIYGWN